MSREAEVDQLGHVSRARASVCEARRLLARPTAKAVEESAACIGSAVESFQHVRRSFRGDPAVAAEVGALRKELALAAALLEGAASFYLGWARLMYTATGGYTVRGEPASPGPARRVSVEG